MPCSPSRVRPMFFRALFALCTVQISASAQTVFVGPASDPDCDYHTLQAAVDAWAASPSTDFLTVYVANTLPMPATALTIHTPAASTGIGINGTYPACHFSADTGRAVLDGTGNGGVPVVDVEGTEAGEARFFDVTLADFAITGGLNPTGNGGGVRVRGNVRLTLFESDVHDNGALNGAGLAVESTVAGTPSIILAGNAAPAAFRDNLATQDGGGLYCADATVYCDHYCVVEGNQAGRNGGGIAQHACGTSLYLPNSSGAPDDQVGLRDNTAVGDGGGAWISGDGYFWINSGNTRNLAPVIGNTAGGDGGGLYYTGMGTSSNQLRGARLEGNTAGGDGGALFADSGFLQVDAVFASACGGRFDGCPRFRDNHADGSGGAMSLSGTARLIGDNLMFSGNSAASASVLRIDGTGEWATLTNSHIAGNHGAPELLRSNGGQFDLRYVTIADNGPDDDALVRFDAPGAFAATNSILYDVNGVDSGIVVDTVPGTTYLIDCVLVHDDSGLDGVTGVTNLVSADPQWDTSGAYPAGVYVPGPDSPAVDACDPGPGTIPDLIGTPRPQDLPKVDGLGSYDMGAVERLRDALFADGFDG